MPGGQAWPSTAEPHTYQRPLLGGMAMGRGGLHELAVLCWRPAATCLPPSPTIATPFAPHRLDLLELDSRASLGLLACELLAKCEAVAVRATRVFLGVCGPFGAQDVAAFHSGADLRKKAEVMAAAAAQLLLLLGGADSGAAADTDGTTAPACPPPPPARRLRSLELRWMCADSLVVVPLPAENVGGAGCSTAAGQAAAAAALESAQAAVHEGEDPTVEVAAERLEQLARELGRLPCTVHAERAAGHRRAMLLRLERHG